VTRYSMVRRFWRDAAPGARGPPISGPRLAKSRFPQVSPDRRARGLAVCAGGAGCAGRSVDRGRLSDVDPRRIGLIVGGSNVQQRELTQVHETYRDSSAFLRPTYALSFMDSDLCGFPRRNFGIRGSGLTVGGASASGQWQLFSGRRPYSRINRRVHCVGRVDGFFALGVPGLRALGAIGSDRYANEPALACRPFDRGSRRIHIRRNLRRRGHRVAGNRVSVEVWAYAAFARLGNTMTAIAILIHAEDETEAIQSAIDGPDGHRTDRLRQSARYGSIVGTKRS